MPHENEQYGVCFCSIICRPTFIGAYASKGAAKTSLTCYRSMLCEKESRDCWYARPTLSKNIPFDEQETYDELIENGIKCSDGCDPIAVLNACHLTPTNEVKMLEDFIFYPDEMGACNFSIEVIKKRLGESSTNSSLKKG